MGEGKLRRGVMSTTVSPCSTLLFGCLSTLSPPTPPTSTPMSTSLHLLQLLAASKRSHEVLRSPRVASETSVVAVLEALGSSAAAETAHSLLDGSGVAEIVKIALFQPAVAGGGGAAASEASTTAPGREEKKEGTAAATERGRQEAPLPGNAEPGDAPLHPPLLSSMLQQVFKKASDAEFFTVSCCETPVLASAIDALFLLFPSRTAIPQAGIVGIDPGFAG